jgi:Protein of unknown function (DUF2510)
MPEAGWYPNPHDPSTLRYYDGQQWTEHVHPAQPAPTETAAGGSTDAAGPHTLQPEPIAHSGGPLETGASWPAAATQSPAVEQQPQYSPVEQQTTQYSPVEQQTAQYSPVEQQTAQYAQVQPQPYQQPGHQGYQQTAQYPPTGPEPAGYGGYQQTYSPAPPAQPPPKKRGRALLVLALVVVLAVAAGAVWYLLRPDKPKFTFAGKDIKDASQVLDRAGSNVSALVKQRHGTSSGSTRCYFALPKHPSGEAKKTDVDSHMRCGPALFVDGDPNAQYLQYLITPTSAGDSVELSVGGQPSNPNPSPIGDFDLKRPDGKSPPSGAGGLTVPAPPAAERDVFTTSDLGPVPTPATSAETAVMVGRDTGVKLVSAGYVPRYGSGDEARSAPAGERLIAFRVTELDGDLGAESMWDELTVAIPGKTPQKVPQSDTGSDYEVIAVPASTTAQLTLTDGGYTQTLSLPDGKPGSQNLAVLTRQHREVTVNSTQGVSMTLSSGGVSRSDTFTTTLTGVDLDFWSSKKPTLHASTPDHALLTIDMTFTSAVLGSDTFGFPTGLLALKLPSGTTVKAQNVATAGSVLNVFEVPANLTSATIVATGAETEEGITFTVTHPVSFPFSIPAG